MLRKSHGTQVHVRPLENAGLVNPTSYCSLSMPLSLPELASHCWACSRDSRMISKSLSQGGFIYTSQNYHPYFFGRVRISKMFMRVHSITASLWQSCAPLSKYCQTVMQNHAFVKRGCLFLQPAPPSSEMCCCFSD